MLGEYYLVVSGGIAVAWTMALLAWIARHPTGKPPLYLLAGPLVTGVLALVEGLSRIASA